MKNVRSMIRHYKLAKAGRRIDARKSVKARKWERYLIKITIAAIKADRKR